MWAPDLNVITYIGTAAAREVIRSYEFGASNKKLKMNVLLTTYELTLRDAKDLGEIKWQALAVDEVRYCAILVSGLLIGECRRRKNLSVKDRDEHGLRLFFASKSSAATLRFRTWT